MPYIRPEFREALEPYAQSKPINPGELNYVVTRIISAYLGSIPTYALINDAIGALECAKLELYRRVATPYEDEKWKSNGDVYLTRRAE